MTRIDDRPSREATFEPDVLDTRTFAFGLLEAAPDAILLVHADGRIGLANRMAERMFGYPRKELIGLTVEALIPTERREAHVQHRLRYARAPRSRAMGELESLEARTATGETIPVEISLSPVDTTEGRMTIAIIRDVRRRRALEEELRRASTHDALTGCFNRMHLDAIREALDESSLPIGIVMVDVDGLKSINDRSGHEVGDQILRRCALVLRSSFGPSSVVVRLGGDEFVVVMLRTEEAALAASIARLRDDIAHHNSLTRGPLLAISIGSSWVTQVRDFTAGMRTADRRMYEDKRSHRPAPPR